MKRRKNRQQKLKNVLERCWDYDEVCKVLLRIGNTQKTVLFSNT